MNEEMMEREISGMSLLVFFIFSHDSRYINTFQIAAKCNINCKAFLSDFICEVYLFKLIINQNSGDQG
jgi:hypothetical protein